MHAQRLVIGLTLVNLIFVLVVLARGGPTVLQSDQSVLRAEAIELVDQHGQIRAQLTVESDGETIFRLRDEQGTVRVKLGASADGSGLLLANNLTEPGVHILSKSSGSSLTLMNQDGLQRVISP